MDMFYKGAGHYSPYHIMTVRRFLLLLFSLATFVLMSFELYVTAEMSLLNNIDMPLGMPQSSEVISFPYIAKDNSVTLQMLTAYEGPYLEDGTDDEVVDVVALHVFNNGFTEISNLLIELIWEGGSYVFVGEHIPPKETVALLEKDRKSFAYQNFTACTVWQTTSLEYNIQDQILITEEALGTVIVTNLTDTIFHNVNVYYKTWLNPPDILVGGITYQVVIPELLPLQTVFLYPYHYACGYNKVVSITSDQPVK